jgi:hypothetical protein
VTGQFYPDFKTGDQSEFKTKNFKSFFRGFLFRLISYTTKMKTTVTGKVFKVNFVNCLTENIFY